MHHCSTILFEIQFRGCQKEVVLCKSLSSIGDTLDHGLGHPKWGTVFQFHHALRNRGIPRVSDEYTLERKTKKKLAVDDEDKTDEKVKRMKLHCKMFLPFCFIPRSVTSSEPHKSRVREREA